jgi:hypothetical protein
MSHRPGHGGPGNQADTEAEAIATATAIAGLRWRLSHHGTLEHPAVQRELRKLEEQVTAQLADQADRNPGRHRSLVGGGQQISDASGYDLKPDPLTATTTAQFIKTLWQYKVWSGDPSWRKMAAQAGQTVVHSTMHAAMHGDALPKLDVVKAIITGCGGGEDDLRTFATAWRRIESGRTGSANFLTAPVPTLRLVPSG